LPNVSDNQSVHRAALIGGTGFSDDLSAVFGQTGVQLTIHTEYGDAFPTIYSIAPDQEIVFIPRHGKRHAIPPHRINHKANIAALAQMNAQAVIATSAVGSLNAEYGSGSLAILSDFIDHRGKVETFFEEIGNVRHTDFSEPMDLALRRKLLEISIEELKKLHNPTKITDKAVYICVNGPRYETPAEIKMFALWGADVVGMTAAPEAILARELGLRYANLAIVTNLASGISSVPLNHGEVARQMEFSRPLILQIIIRTLKAIINSGIHSKG